MSVKRFSDLAAGIDGIDPCKLDPIDPVYVPVKSFTEIEVAGFSNDFSFDFLVELGRFTPCSKMLPQAQGAILR